MERRQISLACWESNPQLPSCPAPSLVTIPTEIFQLCCRRHRLRNDQWFPDNVWGGWEEIRCGFPSEWITGRDGLCLLWNLQSTWMGVTLGHSAERTDIKVRRISQLTSPSSGWPLPDPSTLNTASHSRDDVVFRHDNRSRHNDRDWMSHSYPREDTLFISTTSTAWIPHSAVWLSYELDG